ncbi:MAG: lytic murein transglycosylase [Pseudomonadota bacterium]
MTKARTGLAPAVAAAIALSLSGCASNAGEPLTANGKTAPVSGASPAQSATPVPRPVSSTVTQTGTQTGTQTAAAKPLQINAGLAQPATFGEWRSGFRARAIAAGIRPDVVDGALAGITPNTRVIELDNRQPEFSRPIWAYLDSAVSSSRIATGRDKARTKRTALARIEEAYQVDAEAVVAIWGLESAFGANFGDMSVIRSMATLAYDGRRKAFAEQQLIAALKILQAGDISRQRMVGSWAGAMGHTQFIPTSFLEYAQDFTGDGRRDIWAADALDALASTANYLAKFGWTRGAPAVVEVQLPAGFDYSTADQSIRRSAAEWRAAGVKPLEGALPDSDGVAILIPAGAAGPAFAAYPNFRVIKRYNNATSYALAVAHLADRIAGGGPFVGAWPREEKILSRTEKQELQSRLTALGYDTQGVDGIIGPNSRSAVRQFQQANRLTPDGFVSAGLLRAVRAAGG